MSQQEEASRKVDLLSIRQLTKRYPGVLALR